MAGGTTTGRQVKFKNENRNKGVPSIYGGQHDLGLYRSVKEAKSSKNKISIVNAYADPAAALTMEEGIRSPMRAYSTASDHVPAEEIRQEVKVLRILYAGPRLDKQFLFDYFGRFFEIDEYTRRRSPRCWIYLRALLCML